MSTPAELSQLDRIEMKIDFLFGLISNKNMAEEFLQAYQLESQKPEDQRNAEVRGKAEKMFRFHHKNLKDSIQYYVEMFGQESNDKVIATLEAMGYNLEETETPVQAEPAPVTNVEASGSHTSETEDK